MQTRLAVSLPRSAAGGEVALAENFFHFMSCTLSKEGQRDLQGPEVDVFCALRYQGEVNNGGHFQFIANTDDDRAVSSAALSGLRLIGANPQAEILAEMIGWAESNPPELGTISSEMARPAALDPLDDRFFEANSATLITGFAATWIGKLPDLKFVSDEEYLAIVA